MFKYVFDHFDPSPVRKGAEKNSFRRRSFRWWSRNSRTNIRLLGDMGEGAAWPLELGRRLSEYSLIVICIYICIICVYIYACNMYVCMYIYIYTHFFKHVMRSIPDIKWWVSHGFSSHHHIPDISQPQPRHIHGSFSQSDHPPTPSTKAWWKFEVVVTPKKIDTCFQDGMHDI